MRALDIDRRIIFIFVFIGVAVPLMVEFSIPIKPTPPVIAAYDAFEKVAAEKPGSTILLSFSYGASTAPEMQPMARAVLRHCFRLGFKVVGICLWPDGVGLAEAVLKQVSEELGKKEDIDYAFLGYKPGTTAVILNMGQDLHTAFPVDSKGVSLADVPVTKDIHPLTDFSFVFDFAAGDSIEFWWIPYGQEKYRFPFAGGCTAVMAPDLFPFLQSGQMLGMLGGLAGAAEYETLIGHQEQATEGMRPQSVTHLIIIFFIILGNGMYFLSRRSAGEATG